MPKVSVIIPTFDREQFVTKAIDSVLSQTYDDYEIIVIDDGSTDNTRSELEPYGKEIRYLWQENGGVSSARNLGIKQAQGEWVAFLDSDDEWTKDYLSTQIAQIRKFPHAVGHITNAVTIYRNGERRGLFFETGLLDLFETGHCLVIERPFGIIIKYGSWLLQSLIVRRDALLKVGLFDAQLSIAEDIDLFARVALRGPLTFCRKELVEIFRREEAIENLTAQSFKKGAFRFRSFGKVYQNLLTYQGLSWLERMTLRNALSKNLRALGNVLVIAGKTSEARYPYRRAFLLQPSFKSLIKYLGAFFPDSISRALVRKGRGVCGGPEAE